MHKISQFMTNCNAHLELVDVTYLNFLFVGMTKRTANLFEKIGIIL